MNNFDMQVTTAAAERILALLAEEGLPTGGLRVYVQGGGCSGFQYGMVLAPAADETDSTLLVNNVSVFVDPVSRSYLHQAEIDFVDSITGGGFVVHNPHATTTCGCGSSFTM